MKISRPQRRQAIICGYKPCSSRGQTMATEAEAIAAWNRVAEMRQVLSELVAFDPEQQKYTAPELWERARAALVKP